MRRTRAWHTAQASKAEALLAVDAYNRTGERRSLEAFVIHMHLAWLYLLHAELTRDHIDFRYRREDGRRLVMIDGEPKTWDLAKCVDWRWPSRNHPVRRNIEFFIGLRNKIEHRYETAVATVVGGHAQSLILNYEEELTEHFGDAESLADQLRFPVFISSLTQAGIDAVKRARSRLPARTKGYLADFEDSLESDVAQDLRFEFRIHLVPQIGPKTDADMAISFVRLDDLSPSTQKALAKVGKIGVVGSRTKERPVKNLRLHRPTDVVKIVAAEVPGFNMGGFVRKWQEHKVRPARGAKDPSATDERYAVYDEVHRDYAYTDAYASRLIRELKSN